MPDRPSCSVIAPFAGPQPELERFLADLAAVVVRPGDELLVADNRPEARAGTRGHIELVAAAGPPSAYYARGVAARRARGEWLVFVDADTAPDPALLDAYFSPPPAPATAVLAGGIEDWTEIDTRPARHIAARRKLSDATTLAHPYRPYAQTANCAVRRAAFVAVGGFGAPVRSGGDADLCWRLAAAGHGLESRPAARVRHRNRTTWRALYAQLHRHGAGMAWLDARWPGSCPPPSARELAHRFTLPLADQVAGWARDLGRLRGNEAGSA